MARETADEISNPRVLLDAFKDKYKLLEGQIAVIQKKTELVSFERDACYTKVGRFQTLPICYLDACSQVAKRLSDEVICFEAGCVAPAYKAEHELSHFQRALALSMNDCVGLHIAPALASVSEHRWAVVDILRGVEGE